MTATRNSAMERLGRWRVFQEQQVETAMFRAVGALGRAIESSESAGRALDGLGERKVAALSSLILDMGLYDQLLLHEAQALKSHQDQVHTRAECEMALSAQRKTLVQAKAKTKIARNREQVIEIELEDMQQKREFDAMADQWNQNRIASRD